MNCSPWALSIEPASPVGGTNLKGTGDFGSWALAGGYSHWVCVLPAEPSQSLLYLSPLFLVVMT